VIVDFYKEVGYLPEAIVNYLLLLGWAYDDKAEFFTRPEMIEKFALEKVNNAAASFDCKKLWAFQEHYMQQVPLNKKVEMVLPYLQKAKLIASAEGAKAKVTAIVQAAGDRIKTAGDILDYRDFFVADDELVYDDKAFDKRLRKPPEAKALLAKFTERLAAAESFEPAALEKLLQAFVAAEGIEVGQIVHAVRVAVTGKGVGFGLFETLAILGKEKCVARIDQTLSRNEPA
jgi:glutamyl-tRNA synthetase